MISTQGAKTNPSMWATRPCGENAPLPALTTGAPINVTRAKGTPSQPDHSGNTRVRSTANEIAPMKAAKATAAKSVVIQLASVSALRIAGS